jgi:hypothetical protein
MSIYSDLQDALSEALLGHPYDKSENLDETGTIDSLVWTFREYATGDIEIDDLVNAFGMVPFDIMAFVTDLEDSGAFVPEMERDNAS